MKDYKLLPVEPTEQQINEAYEALCYGPGPALTKNFDAAIRRVYAAFMEFAPEPPASRPKKMRERGYKRRMPVGKGIPSDE